MSQLTQAEAFARIRLLRSPHFGPATFHRLLRRFGSASAVLEALPLLAAKGGGRSYRAAREAGIRAEIEAVKAAGARYIFHDSPDYPPLLRAADGAPPILVARGDAGLAAQTPVAIVGARNASAGAMRLAREWAGELASRGHAVVSGLARGIDTAAHRGAIEAGATIAVIATGIDIAYPPENEALHAEIAARGLLLTELPPGTGPHPRGFPARNRIIAGLALGTLVVEAAPGSGSLLTARAAGELGREVMAVPGSPLDPRSRGGNGLIRDGAVLVQSADDVAELLRGFDGGARLASAARLAAGADLFATVDETAPEMIDEAAPAPSLARDIATLLGPAPVSIDELVRQSAAPASEVQMALIEMELAGRLTRHAGGKVSLA